MLFFAKNSQILTTLFNIILGKEKQDSGNVFVGKTIKLTNLPQNYDEYFDNVHLSLVDWLRQFSNDQNETYIRSWLGRMLFTGEENMKEACVLSGGEKVRCMLAKMMLQQGNTIILDEPTNHLDLESITALNKGMQNFKGTMLFATHDQEIIETVADRIIEIVDEDHYIDYTGTFEQYAEKYNR